MKRTLQKNVEKFYEQQPKKAAVDKETEKDTAVALVFLMNNILHSLVSNFQVDINNQWPYS